MNKQRITKNTATQKHISDLRLELDRKREEMSVIDREVEALVKAIFEAEVLLSSRNHETQNVQT